MDVNTKIIIKFDKDDKEIELSLDQAKELYDKLKEICDNGKEYIPLPLYPAYPTNPYYIPPVYTTNTRPLPDTVRITC